MKRLFQVLFTGFLMILCGNQASYGQYAKVTPNPLTLEVGETKTLTLEYEGYESFGWAYPLSTNVIKFDSQGGSRIAKVTGMGPGSEQVYVTLYKSKWSEEFTRIYVNITVTRPDPIRIDLNYTNLTLQENDSKQLTATVFPSGASQEVKWSVVSGSNVVSVSSSGRVTANTAGTAKVRATSAVKSSVWKDCEVTVKPNSPEIQFADTKVKTLCVANWDTNHDDKLNEAEAAAVMSLGEVFKSNKEITSFDELKYFTGLKEIPNDAFDECSSLTAITIPNSVTSIGNGAFYKCSGLTSVNIGNSVTSIGNYAFEYCSGLTSINIPNSVKSIGRGAFYSCSSLTSITIPDGVTFIEEVAFSNCI